MQVRAQLDGQLAVSSAAPIPADDIVVVQVCGERSGLGQVDARRTHVEGQGLETFVSPPDAAQARPDRIVRYPLEGLAAAADLPAQHRLDVGIESDGSSHVYHDAV
jgi:hypothetical protein